MLLIPAAPTKQPGCSRWFVLAWLGAMTMTLPPAAAQVPPPSREELLRKWDLDRNGKIDANETEIARARMRRDRTETLLKSGTDPLTGRPRTAADAEAGRPPAVPQVSPEQRVRTDPPIDDGGLILVPGTGQPADRGASSAALPPLTPRISNPGVTDAPVSPPGRDASARDTSGSDRSSRARMLPGTPSAQAPQFNAGARDPRQRDPSRDGLSRDGLSRDGLSRERQPGAGERPGIISGGVRAGGPAARPGYGAGGPVGDLNAGRQLRGLPPTRQTAVGPVTDPRRGAVPPPPPLRQPDGVRPPVRPPFAAPRAPRVSVDEFQGR